MSKMMQFIWLWLFILNYIQALPEIAVKRRCSPLGGYCDRSIVHPCCKNSVCELHGFANGTCVKCLDVDWACLSNSECCSGICRLVKCQPKKKIKISVY
ncbi:unnamed protein product [Schistosoma guineensis]|uniref:UPF0506 protein n=2 Tax=Schistosoma haematobium TaxID=6185 RepID=A0A094ZI87_SCHHA|nr:unnamed protein product [Schistosoma guineensis]CAH8629075.1 unnamed protein product [Schistosoma haematobium]